MKTAEIDHGFRHLFIPGRTGANGRVLLLLHGTGGTEHDLLPVGKRISASASLLSVRGQVNERGMSRFFRRIAEGEYDMEDLANRTDQLAQFVTASARSYRFKTNDLVIVGYSNGANIGANLLFRHPELTGGAILLRPWIPFEPDGTVRLSGMPVRLHYGESDEIVPRAASEHLSAILGRTGAASSVHWYRAGHALTETELDEAALWFTKTFEGSNQ